MSDKITINPPTPEQDEYLRGIMERAGKYDPSYVVGGPRAMTSSDDRSDLVERLREIIRGDGNLTPYLQDAFIEAATTIASLREELDKARERVAKLEARLEIDHCFRLKNGKMEREEIPPEERDRFPDGITARDSSIDLLEDHVKELKAEIEELRQYAPSPEP